MTSWRTQLALLPVAVAFAACDGEPTIPNRPPSAEQIPAQTIHVGERRHLFLPTYFADPDGDALTYRVVSGQPHLVAAAVVRDTLVLSAAAQGVAEVTVTATDPEGLSVSAVVEVMVPNRAPVVSVPPPDQRLAGPGRTVVLDVSGFFSDPDGDSLAFEASSADTSVVMTSVSESALMLTGGATGGVAEVTVTARDPEGAEARAGFAVAVNRAPVVVEIPAQTLVAETPALELGLAPYASDPDGDSLVFEASSANTSVVAASVSGAVLTLEARGVRYAEAQVTLTVSDPDGLEASATFAAVVQENPDRATLEAFWHATSGWQWAWPMSRNWMTDLPLEDWYAVEMNEAGRVSSLGTNTLYNFSGHIPPELGDLEALERLSLLAQLDGRFTGPIPPELGNLGALERLVLRGNFTGPIPPELGNLQALELLALWGYFTGPIPAQLGNLNALKVLSLGGNRLSGHIPPELGDLESLEFLLLDENYNLSGPVPSELRDLAPALKSVRLDGNEELCADESMRAWLEDKWPGDTVPPGGGVRPCDDALAGAYLMQAVQSRESPVPLVAGEDALIRVFTLSPPVVARFYLDGAEAHVAEIPRLYFDAGEGQGDGEDLTAAAVVPGSVVQPGLEMVVEGEGGRIPAEGRLAIDVREMPMFNLTLVPFCSTNDDEGGSECVDIGHVAVADSMAVDPDHWRLRATADLLPVGAMRVTAHAPVECCANYSPPDPLLEAVSVVRALEGGTGHWMGLGGLGGRAYAPGWVSRASVEPFTIAHELGHNFSLWHAPCGNPGSVDPQFPYPGGTIGARGFVSRDVWWGLPNPRRWRAQQIVSPETRDLMSYCDPAWISDYHFEKALEFRLWNEGEPASRVAARVPVRSLLLWGGADSTGAPVLEPTFVVEAPPSLPDRAGPWTIEGRARDGSVLFALPFAMPKIADAGEGAGGFAFVLPVGSGWEALASLTLSGPGGTATLDAETDRPMSIWRDRDGQVRAILRGVPDGGATPLVGTDGLEVLVSRGVPGADAWRRW